MLNEKELQLLQQLAQSTAPVTARELSAKLGISIRTVESYIQRINCENPETVSSSQRGYRADAKAAKELLDQQGIPGDVPQTNEERVAYLLHLMLAAPEALDTFDVCEHLYVSYSTVKNVIADIRKKIAPLHLELKMENNQLLLVGSERDKRRLLSDLLYNETAMGFLDLTIIQHAFPDIDVPRIEVCIREALDENQCFANDYSLVNLILHIAITIDRIRNGRGQVDSPSTQMLDAAISPQDLEMARAITHALESAGDVEFNKTEVSELALLLASRTTMLDYRMASRDNIERFVGGECLEVVNEMIGALRENAGIDLSDHEFFVRFALHIKNLITRARTGSLSKNPFTSQIKSSCPLLYDTAVIQAGILQRRLNVYINDDEIAYIAFHLGSTLETQKQLTNKIKAVLFCPSYYNVDAKILLFLERYFENDLIVTNVVTDKVDLEHLHGADLLITTVPLTSYYGIPTHLLGIIPKESDRANLQHVVDDIHHEKRRSVLKAHLERLILPELFSVNATLTTRDQVIHCMADRLIQRGYANADFEQQVFEREALSSTAYGTVALPHSLRQTSPRSSISVMISTTPIFWGDDKVDLIFLLSFSKTDQEVFYEVFDPLVSILSDREQISLLAGIDDYQQFIARLCEMMQ
ncbi:BglG family transcription antiterminator [Collinsella provencensis]|uniref:BglG family transcription antiterminator n=1 Tax=Collinsella provencensis TaxID=1937461 RepID=UPI000C84E4D2|nr:PRD domain-containing protein [Collinsella provencensis]